jgi:Tol biopolymer transport system component
MFFSPDGRYIAYGLDQSSSYPKRDIFLLKTDGSGDSIPLVTHPADDQLLGWLPDGKRLLFATNRTGVKTMAVIEVHEGQSQGAAQLVRRLEMGFSPRGLTRNGSYYYSIENDVIDVYTATLDMETGKVVVPPALIKTSMEGLASTPCWSSDGQYLAYLSKTRSDGMESLPWWGYDTITIRSVKTHEVREVKPSAQIKSIFVRTLEWSPDGRSFLIQGVRHQDFPQYCIDKMDAQTGEVSLITHAADEGERCILPKWSVDGKSIFYQRGVRNGAIGARILERNLETGKEREIAKDVSFGSSGPTFYSDFSLSPDGRRVAFIKEEILENETPSASLLKVKPLAGGEATELFRGQGGQGHITLHGWTPDGRYILFQDKGFWRIPATGGEPRKIELTMKRIAHLRVHPDGRQVAFDVEGQKLELWVMENFLPESTTSK